jgi:hypothetical protein
MQLISTPFQYGQAPWELTVILLIDKLFSISGHQYVRMSQRAAESDKIRYSPLISIRSDFLAVCALALLGSASVSKLISFRFV